MVILPGFHTAAEDAMKRVGRNLPGNDLFLSVCGLMANGARTVLLSRWRSGGQTSFDLVREFAQELSDTTPADAWQRAVMLTVDSRLNLEAEPRIKRAASRGNAQGEPIRFSGPASCSSIAAPRPKSRPRKRRSRPQNPANRRRNRKNHRRNPENGPSSRKNARRPGPRPPICDWHKVDVGYASA